MSWGESESESTSNVFLFLRLPALAAVSSFQGGGVTTFTSPQPPLSPIFNFRLRPPSPSVPYLFFGTLYTDIKRERKRVQWRRKRRQRRGGEVFSDGGEDSSSLHCNSPPPARRCRFTPLLRPSLPLKASLAVRESAAGARRKKRKSVRQGGGKSTEPRLREQK